LINSIHIEFIHQPTGETIPCGDGFSINNHLETSMSRFAACITDLPEMVLADRYYSFIQDKGDIPDDDTIHFHFKNSKDYDDACHKINYQFVIHLEDALLNAVSAKNRDFFCKQLFIETYSDDLTPEFDKVTIRFQERVLHDPDIDAIEDLYNHMAQQDAYLHSGGAKFEPTYSIDVTPDIFEKIKDIVEEGILESRIDSSCGMSQTIILELKFIQELAITNQNSRKILDDVWKTLIDFKPEIIFLKKVSPALLMLNTLLKN